MGTIYLNKKKKKEAISSIPGVINLSDVPKGTKVYASAEEKATVERVTAERKERLKDPKYVEKEKRETESAELAEARRTSGSKDAVIRYNAKGIKKTWVNASAADKSGYTFTNPPAQRETIKLTPKKEEKTGISKLREEDSIIGTAIRVATDWRTTVALVGTLATVASLGTLIAPTAAVTATITRTATLGAGARAATITAQRGFLGKPVGGILTKLVNKIPTGATRTAIPLVSNTKNIALTTSMLKKAGMLAGVAGGMAGSLFLGQWAQAEAPEGLTIALRDALKQAQQTGDWSIYNDAREIVDEITDLNVWEKIALWTPFAPFIGIPNKMKGVIEGAKLLDKIAERGQQKQKEEEGEPTFAEQREQSDIESRERKEAWRKEDEEYYEKQREESEEYYEEIEESKRRRELRERSEDEKYWEGIRKEGEERKTAERKEDEEYWDEIYRKKEERKSGEKTTPYTYWKKKKKEKTNEPWNEEDKRIVDNWNAGKSALNFKWLGL